MSDFFNRYFNIKKMREGKREYRRWMARVKALPEDYRFVFERIQEYMWMFAGGDGMDIMEIHYGVIELFEDGAANGKHVLDITGRDVAAFCDELLRGAKQWLDHRREKLNGEIEKRFGNGKKGR